MSLKESRVVYVILNIEVGRVKIGITGDIKGRFSILATQGGCEMEMYYHTQPMFNSKEIESKCHNHFREQRYIGEWFNVTKEQAKEYLETIADTFELDKVLIMAQNGEQIEDIARFYRTDTNKVKTRLREHSSSLSFDKKPPKKKGKPIVLDICKYKNLGKGLFLDKDKNIVTIKFTDGAFRLI